MFPLRMTRGLQVDQPTVVSDPASGHSRSLAAYGEFDLHTGNLIASAITAALTDGARHLVLDLRHASFFDCSTLHALMRAVEPLRSEPSASVAVTGARGIVKRLFDIVGVDPLMPVARPREDAIAALRARSPGHQTTEIAG